MKQKQGAMSIIIKNLEYGKKLKTLYITFFDILKNLNLRKQNPAVCIVKSGVEQKIGLKPKSTEN